MGGILPLGTLARDTVTGSYSGRTGRSR